MHLPYVFHVGSSNPVLWPRGSKKDEAYLLGILSSIPLDWYSRFVEINFNLTFFTPLPIPRLEDSVALKQRIIKISGRLASPDERFKIWATQVNVNYGKIGNEEKGEMIAELDSLVSIAYNLEKAEIIHIFESFHKNWDFYERLNKVLKYYDYWKSKQ